VVARRLEAERVEVGVQMAAHAVGADQHQGADRIAGGALDVGRGDLGAARLRPRAHLVAERLFDLSPVAVECRDEFAALRLRPVRLLPGGAVRAAGDVGGAVLQARKEGLPLGVHRARIGLIAGVQVLDIGGVAAIEERTLGKGRIGVLARHPGILAEGRKPD
jgi:hypothetical protein